MVIGILPVEAWIFCMSTQHILEELMPVDSFSPLGTIFSDSALFLFWLMFHLWEGLAISSCSKPTPDVRSRIRYIPVSHLLLNVALILDLSLSCALQKDSQSCNCLSFSTLYMQSNGKLTYDLSGVSVGGRWPTGEAVFFTAVIMDIWIVSNHKKARRH